MKDFPSAEAANSTGGAGFWVLVCKERFSSKPVVTFQCGFSETKASLGTPLSMTTKICTCLTSMRSFAPSDGATGEENSAVAQTSKDRDTVG